MAGGLQLVSAVQEENAFLDGIDILTAQALS
jgi:hypothetical protein